MRSPSCKLMLDEVTAHPVLHQESYEPCLGINARSFRLSLSPCAALRQNRIIAHWPLITARPGKNKIPQFRRALDLSGFTRFFLLQGSACKGNVRIDG